ncbi:MAG: TlpA family protein disulfide reductase [Rhodanobacter sp.]|nr:MAG: TlpA family protein disulfide reductase [Rhodanobacter sp.]
MLSRGTGLILALAVLVAALGGWLQHRSTQLHRADSPLLGKALPALSLRDLNGVRHRLDDYRGHRVLVNLWATWCGPCLREMPALNRAQASYAKQGVVILGIAMDQPSRVRRFLASHPVDYPILLGQLGASGTSLQLGNTGELLPYSLLINAEGEVVASHAGALSSAQLTQWLAPTRSPP